MQQSDGSGRNARRTGCRRLVHHTSGRLTATTVRRESPKLGFRLVRHRMQHFGKHHGKYEVHFRRPFDPNLRLSNN
jgi:hypothetical protein